MKTTLRGRVVSGIARAGYYVDKYRDLFKPLLGTDPYPGTLNIKLDKCIWEYTKGLSPLVVKPSEPGLCEAYVFRGRVGGIDVLIVKPSVTIHDCTIVELIAGVKLRDLLSLRDGDVVEIAIVDES